MKYVYLLLLTFIFSTTTLAQFQVFSDNMETVVSTWIAYEDTSPNYWIANTCAGNGPSEPGTKSFYITSGGSETGCVANGSIAYAFANSDNGSSKSALIAHEINASCYTNLAISFNYRIFTDQTNDYAQLVFSLDNGITWEEIMMLNTSLNWTTISQSLPVNLNNQSFLLGFRFVYNEATVSGNPIAFDNLLVTGDDVEAPVVVCPTTFNLIVNNTCSAEVEDYRNFVSITDNCNGTFNSVQIPASGTTIDPLNTQIEIQVFDLAGNVGSCTFNVTLVDTIKPIMTCIEELNVDIDGSCSYEIPDLIPSITNIFDNCTTASDLIFSQTPAIASIGQGITNVYLTVTDEAGNSRECAVRLLPNDIEAPTITCPPMQAVNNGSACATILQNYTGLAVVSDNCILVDVLQTPAPGTVLTSGFHSLTLTAQDEMGNQASCMFQVLIEESVAPQILFCPNDVTTCNPLVSYTTPVASDNCAVTVTQTDATGFSSGQSFPVGTTNLIYTASDPSGNTATCTFSVTVIPMPSPAIIEESIVSLCETSNYNLDANDIANGVGTWTQIQGTGTIANPLVAQTNVTDLGYGLNTFVWSVASGTCGVNRDTIYITNYETPTIATTQTDSSFACAVETSMLLGSFPAVGSGLWTSTGSATVVSPTNHNTQATDFEPGWNDFVYTISNGTCPSSSATISVYANYPAKIITSDTSICFKSGNFPIVGIEPLAGQNSVWYFIQGQGEINDPFSSNTFAYDFKNGNSKIVYRFSHPICGFSYDTIAVNIISCESEELVIPTIFTPNNDGKNDSFVILNLQDYYPECNVTIVNRWGSIVYESTGYENPWDGTFNGEALPFGTYFYRINLNDEEKKSYSGSISIIR
jgi:gliding motility-associated-like protein